MMQMRRADVHRNRYTVTKALRHWRRQARKKAIQHLKVHDARVYYNLRLQVRVIKVSIQISVTRGRYQLHFVFWLPRAALTLSLVRATGVARCC